MTTPTPSNTSRRPYEQVVVAGVWPSIDGGRHPVKALVGDVVPIEATVFRHGHEKLRVVVQWQAPGQAEPIEEPMRLVNPGLDRWRADLPVRAMGRHRFTVAAWTDRYASWVDELGKRVQAAQADVHSEIAEGLGIVERAWASLAHSARSDVESLLHQLRGAAGDPAAVFEIASHSETLDLMAWAGPRDDEARFEPTLTILAERERAAYGAWYEIFVRSQSAVPGRPGTFCDATRRLPEIRAMGFDVVYLAPIHPIGHTNRKGPNNKVGAGPNDPGSPWAIGSEAGGHTAIEPALGALADFDRFVQEASALGLEVALDLALQCSPDHPWVREHPEWFYRRPDGTIRYAENPPKKYEDIYPLNFDTPEWMSLWEALREVVLFWVRHGVRIFRVDNPHTKPVGFWAWLIEQVHEEHPDVVFLAEAFTRPPMMRGLGARGFSQSYTYFTWRNTKAELIEYLTELLDDDMRACYRPNFFANTPDILPPILQTGGRAAFKQRLLLAATLSPSYGIYSGFELCEGDAIPGREEYLNSEKYEIKTRDWHAPGNLVEFVRTVNQARRDNRALQRLEWLRFLDTDSDQVLAYLKATPDLASAVIVVVNLDPSVAHSAWVDVPADALGLPPGRAYAVDDLLTGASYRWTTGRNYVYLDPLGAEPAHLLRVDRG